MNIDINRLIEAVILQLDQLSEDEIPRNPKWAFKMGVRLGLSTLERLLSEKSKDITINVVFH